MSKSNGSYLSHWQLPHTHIMTRCPVLQRAHNLSELCRCNTSTTRAHQHGVVLSQKRTRLPPVPAPANLHTHPQPHNSNTHSTTLQQLQQTAALFRRRARRCRCPAQNNVDRKTQGQQNGRGKALPACSTNACTHPTRHRFRHPYMLSG